MECSTCQVPLVRFSVPSNYQAYVPNEAESVGFCPVCFRLESVETTPADPRFDRISQAFPTDPTAAIPMALALGLLESIALNRSAIQALLDDVETAGTDPLLLIDRLVSQGSIQPRYDLDRRRDQLEQLR